MCGIIGYTGDKDAAPILLEGLKRLEYRGYDSAGMAVLNRNGGITILKDAGRVGEIQKSLDFLRMTGSTGIAHTRWATHGAVTMENAHPHASCHGEVAIVHNGIIENHQELKRTLEERGHLFTSETDSEVIAHLLEEAYAHCRSEKEAVSATVRQLKGSYAFLAVFEDRPGIVGVRAGAPLAVGLGVGGNFASSDPVSFIGHTDQAVFLENGEIVLLGRDGFQAYTFDGVQVRKKAAQLAWEAASLSREDFTHYTLKEIKEQVETVERALLQDSGALERFAREVLNAEQLYITGCGTSYHTALVAKYLFASVAGKPAEVILSSEFGQYRKIVNGRSLMIAISQSGETADVLEAVKEAKQAGAKVFSIVNVAGSTLSRESALNLYTNCGPEIGVAATKSFTSQLMVINMLASKLSKDKGPREVFNEASTLVRDMLRVEERIEGAVERYKKSSDIYFLGRGIHYPIALEGALKMKELSYIHAEGLAAGELKHGSLALISEGTPVVVINPEDETYVDSLSNAAEVKARGGRVIAISTSNNQVYDEFIPLPRANPMLYPVLEVIPLQLFAYHAAVARQSNPDYPRNLAKSVTVK